MDINTIKETAKETLWAIVSGVQGKYGTLGSYVATLELFYAFVLIGPITFIIDAPFGRFGAQSPKWLQVDGNIAWLLMELVAPATFLISFYSPPLGITPIPSAFDLSIFSNRSSNIKLSSLSPKAQSFLLPSLFLIHYLNRSIISTIRNPHRAPMNPLVPLSAFGFNLCNGFLLGSWLGGRVPGVDHITNQGQEGLSKFRAVGLVVGFGLWALGFVGNLIHDDVLYDLKRKAMADSKSKSKPKSAKSKGKGKAIDDEDRMRKGNAGKPERADPKSRYSIPHGWLYDRPFGGVSNPAYLCEWVEWIGFAIACSSSYSSFSSQSSSSFSISLLPQALQLSALDHTLLSPPWLFVWTEVATMLPRAVRTHKWYKTTFGDELPKARKAIIPGVV